MTFKVLWDNSITSLADDTSPQLGGELDVDGNDIVGSSETGTGGSAVIRGGPGTTDGGALDLHGGTGGTNLGGDINLRGGQGDGTGGNVNIRPTIAGARTYFRIYNVGNTDYIGFQCANSPASSIDWIFPSTDPTVGQVLASSAPSGTTAFFSWVTKLSNVSEDSTPTLGGDLDTAGNNIAPAYNSAGQGKLQGASTNGATAPGLCFIRGGGIDAPSTQDTAGDARVLGGTNGSTDTVDAQTGGNAVLEGGASIASTTNGHGGDAVVRGGIGTASGGDVIIQPSYDNTDLSDNGAVILQPVTTGYVPELQFREDATNGFNYVGLKAPASLAGDTPYTFPDAYPSLNGNTFADGNALISNESGTMEWDVVTHDSTTLQTTDNTTQDLRTFSVPSGSTVVVEFTIAAYDSTNNEGGSVRHGSASAVNVGGNTTLIASSVTTDGLATSTATVSVDVEDTLDVLRIRVTGGPATTTIDWKLSARILTQ